MYYSQMKWITCGFIIVIIKLRTNNCLKRQLNDSDLRWEFSKCTQHFKPTTITAKITTNDNTEISNKKISFEIITNTTPQFVKINPILYIFLLAFCSLYLCLIDSHNIHWCCNHDVSMYCCKDNVSCSPYILFHWRNMTQR